MFVKRNTDLAPHSRPSVKVSSMVTDVVCQMKVDEKTAKWKSEYKGKTYYFCGPTCKRKFDQNSEKYIRAV